MSPMATCQPTVRDALPRVRAAACAECGSPVESGDRFCPACGANRPDEGVGGQPAPQRRFRCQNCGAEVAIDPDQRSYTCAFCDSTYVVELPEAETNRQPPEFVVGFAVAPDEAAERFRRWLGSGNWFRPSDLKAAEFTQRLRGVYLPFWSFSMLAESRWSAQIGEYWYRTETYTTTVNGKSVTRTRRVRETEWWDLAGGHHEYHNGYLISGSRGLAQSHADRIKPFHLAGLKRYAPSFLAGWLSEEYSVERDEALAVCREEFADRERQSVAEFLPGDTHSDLQVRTEFTDVNSDLILLPVYLAVYRHRKRLYRFLMNGQTGKAVGDKPVSWPKIALAVGVALALTAVAALAIAALGQ